MGTAWCSGPSCYWGCHIHLCRFAWVEAETILPCTCQAVCRSHLHTPPRGVPFPKWHQGGTGLTVALLLVAELKLSNNLLLCFLGGPRDGLTIQYAVSTEGRFPGITIAHCTWPMWRCVCTGVAGGQRHQELLWTSVCQLAYVVDRACQARSRANIQDGLDWWLLCGYCPALLQTHYSWPGPVTLSWLRRVSK